MKQTLFFFFVVLLAIGQCVSASSAELVFDLNRGKSPLGSSPQNFVFLDSVLYFTADDGIHGRELWRSDGTPSGTRMFADLVPGPKSSNIRTEIVNLGGALYFSTFSGNTVSLYRIKSGQTQPEKLATFANSNYGIREIQLVSGRLFFAVGQEQYGLELWMWNGSTSQLVKDINPGAEGSYPTRLTEFAGLLYFQAFDPAHGVELWKSDGNEAGTLMIRDINQGTEGSYPDSMTKFGGHLIFAANDHIHGYEIWKTDGTELGTSLIRDLSPGIGPGVDFDIAGFTLFANSLYFSGRGSELYQMNTGFQISLVRDLDPTEQVGILGFLSAGMHYIFFSADDPKVGTSLWRSDGTSAGTVMIVDPYPNRKHAYLYFLDVVGDQVLFMTWGGPGLLVWLSDGTKEGTRQIAAFDEVNEGAGSDNRWFLSLGTFDDGTELYIYDSSQSDPRIPKRIRVGNASSSPRNLITQGNTLFFVASDQNGPGIWETDGKTMKLTHRGPVERLARTSDSLYFLDLKGKLFRIDQEQRVHSIEVQGEIDPYGPMRGVGNRLFFTTSGFLWVSNGTASGTRSILGRHSSHLVLLGNVLYMLAYDGIWRIETDTLRVRRIYNITSNQELRALSVANGKLYFVIKTEERTQFWSSDGTNSSNRKLGETDLETTYFALTYPHWFFNGKDAEHGTEVRMFDLNTRQVVLPKDITTGSASSHPRPKAAFGGILIFGLGWATWRTDGTEEGTYLLNNDQVDCFSIIGSNLYFSAFKETTGAEPYVTDAQDISFVGDLYRGPYSSQACEFTPYKGEVYFAATDAMHGRELWRTPLQP